MHRLFILTIIALLLISACKQVPQQDTKKQVIQDEWKMKAEDGVRLYVTEFGEGDTVVVVHGGFGAEHGYLLNAFMPLADEHHFVLYDQRGSLRSRCDDSLVTVAKHIADLETLRQKLGLSQMTLIGHSMGGYLALRYTSEYPGKVKKLVLLDSPPAKCNIEDLTIKINEPTLARWQRPEVLAELKKYGVEEDWKETYTDQQSSTRNRITFGAINLHDVTKWRAIKGGPLFYSGSAGAAASNSMESQSWNFITGLKKQAIPIYILHGDDDYLPAAYHDSWKDSIPTIKFHLIKDAGHCSWIDNFEDYSKAMNEALR